MRYLPAMLLLAATPVLAGTASAKAPAQQAAANLSASRALGQARLAPGPEPAIWSMMIAGIGFAGAALRRTTRRPRTSARG
jgi:hypothetical protein